MLAAAIDFARAHGATTLEAYPVDASDGRVPAANAFHGTLAMFERAGFTVVERRQWNATTPVRPIVRLELAPARAKRPRCQPEARSGSGGPSDGSPRPSATRADQIRLDRSSDPARCTHGLVGSVDPDWRGSGSLTVASARSTSRPAMSRLRAAAIGSGLAQSPPVHICRDPAEPGRAGIGGSVAAADGRCLGPGTIRDASVRRLATSSVAARHRRPSGLTRLSARRVDCRPARTSRAQIPQQEAARMMTNPFLLSRCVAPISAVGIGRCVPISS